MSTEKPRNHFLGGSQVGGAPRRETPRDNLKVSPRLTKISYFVNFFNFVFSKGKGERVHHWSGFFFSPHVGFRLTWPVVLPTEPSHQTTLFLLTGNLGRLILLKAPDIEIPSVWGFIIREGIKEKWGHLHSAPHMLRSQVWHRERLSCHVE